MKNEIVPLLKSLAVVVVGVLVANYVQTAFLSKATATPATTPAV
jgi:hypothetical protein